MYATMLAGLILITIIGMILLLVGVIVITALVRGGSGGKGSKNHQAEETQLMQELNQGFVRMEKRIEALETILLDKIDPDKMDQER